MFGDFYGCTNITQFKMAEICSCETGIVNFGQPSCLNAFGRASRLIFVNYLDGSGAVNSIKSTDTLDSTFFDGKFNNAVLAQRWYITGTINDVDGERADSITQESDGINFVVKQGTRSFNGNFWGGIADPKFVESVDSIACRQMGVFLVDVSGTLIGINNSITGDLDPIKIQRNTIQNKYMFPTATTVQGINIKFDWEENERDAEISAIKSDNISVNLLDSKAMTTVIFGTPGTITTSTFIVDMTFTYGDQFIKLPYTGAVVGDFNLNEITPTPGVVVISAVLETVGTPGEYLVTFATATSADVLSLDYSKIIGAGFESLVNAPVLIP